MAVPYSTQFSSVGITAATSTTLFTVPAAHVAVVRDIELFYENAAAGTAQVIVNGRSTLWWVAPPSPVSWQQWKGRVVLNPGDVVTVSTSTAGPYGITVSGYLLSQ